MPVDDLWYLSKRGPAGPDGEQGPRLQSKRHGRGKRWRVRWTTPDGEDKTRLFARKVDADNYDASVRADVTRGTYVDPAAGKITLRAHAAAWLARQAADESTMQTTESRINQQILPRLGDRELLAIKPSVVQGMVRGMQADGHAPRYIQVVTALLSTLLAAAVDDELIPRNPCSAASVRLPKVERRKVVPWVIERVWAVADALPDRYEATVYAGYGLGLRQGEIVGLALDDVDWLGRVVHVRRQIRVVRNQLVFAPPKGDKERDVPLSGETALRLAAHVKEYPPVAVTLPWRAPDGKPVTVKVLFSRNGEAIRGNWFGMCLWVPALRAAGVVKRGEPTRGYGMHALRHTYASTLLADGVDIRALAEYLGHSDPGFTLRTYTHLMPQVEDRARVAIDRAFRGPESTAERAAQ